MSIAPINQDALRYWQLTGYNAFEINEICKEIDGRVMAACITFFEDGVNVAITRRTWERQEGHYPTITRYFDEVGRHPLMRGRNGTLVVWLEDGFWEWDQKYTYTCPILSFGRQRTDLRSFLIPDPAFMHDRGYESEILDLDRVTAAEPWNNRKKTIFWRGAATGINIEGDKWAETARGRLVMQAKQIGNPDVFDAKITKVSHLPQIRQNEMEQAGVLGPGVEFAHFLKYRYLVDADGYCCAWKSLLLKLASGSVVIKVQSDYEQWYHRDLIPWKHYIPVRPDLEDLPAIYNWLINNDQKAQQIAQAGRQFISELKYKDTVAQTAELCSKILACQRDLHTPSQIATGQHGTV